MAYGESGVESKCILNNRRDSKGKRKQFHKYKK